MADRAARMRQGGFTLLEVLVAMVLLALIVTLGFSGLHFAARGWDAQLGGADRVAVQASVDGLLRRQLALAVIGAADPVGARAPVEVFQGEAGRAEWLAPLAVAGGGDGLYRIALRLESAAGGDEIWFEYALIDPADADAELDWERRRLRAGLPELRLEYWGRSGLNSELGWHERWEPDAPRAPLLVRLAPARGRVAPDWPDWIAPVGAGQRT